MSRGHSLLASGLGSPCGFIKLAWISSNLVNVLFDSCSVFFVRTLIAQHIENSLNALVAHDCSNFMLSSSEAIKHVAMWTGSPLFLLPFTTQHKSKGTAQAMLAAKCAWDAQHANDHTVRSLATVYVRFIKCKLCHCLLERPALPDLGVLFRH